MITLKELYVHPVKSLSGNSVATSILDRRGLSYDRRWMVVDENGKFLTMRQLPRMTLISVSVDESVLTLTTGDDSFQLRYQEKVLQSTEFKDVSVWSDTVPSVDMGDDVAQWLQQVLERNCRLVYMPDSIERQVDLTYAQTTDIVGFADGFSLLLISQGSLDDLNSRLDSPITMNRFRPNLVVEGCEPFAEDTWRRIRIGGVELEVVKPCSRCAIPTIDPLTGERSAEVWKTLSTFRKRDGEIFFGQNLIHRDEGLFSVGDLVEVLE